MAGSIMLVRDNGELAELKNQGSMGEEALRELLVRQPALLAGDQPDHGVAERWIVVKREAANLTIEEQIEASWSRNHLFLDQDGIPTLVDVHAGTDTRRRHEHLGQMLELWANLQVHWPPVAIRSLFEENCAAKGLLPEQVLGVFLQIEVNPEAFWDRVHTNLLAGKARLLFVAEQIGYELRQTVDFLSRQFETAEVLALEVKQYSGEGVRSLVTRVYGNSRRRQAVQAPTGRQWDQASFLHAIASRQGTDMAWMVKRIIDWTDSKRLRAWWGRDADDGSLFPLLEHEGSVYWTFSLWTSGRVDVQLSLIQQRGPFAHPKRRALLIAKLNEAAGLHLPADGNRLSFPLAVLKDANALKQFLDTFDWYLQEIKLDENSTQ